MTYHNITTLLHECDSEAVVQEALDRVMAGRTTLVIAHRLSTVQHAVRYIMAGVGVAYGVASKLEIIHASSHNCSVSCPHPPVAISFASAPSNPRIPHCFIHQDKIVVVANGAVQEVGDHESLLAANGVYATLVRRQLQRSTAGGSTGSFSRTPSAAVLASPRD